MDDELRFEPVCSGDGVEDAAGSAGVDAIHLKAAVSGQPQEHAACEEAPVELSGEAEEDVLGHVRSAGYGVQLDELVVQFPALVLQGYVQPRPELVGGYSKLDGRAAVLDERR